MAKKTKELNTSCRATFKDGHQEEYQSIEEASEKTGVTVASIKIRCNKPDTKSFPKFEWLDQHTKKHYQAKKSKNKGSSLELEVVHALKGIGFEGVCRAASESVRLDNNKIDLADPTGELFVNIQCKYTQNLPNYYTIRDACTDKDKPFALIWKKASQDGSISPGTVAIIPDSFFYELLKVYKENK